MFGLDFDPYEDDDDEVVTATPMKRVINIDLMSDERKGKLYNALAEHSEGEHTEAWEGCPRCEGDNELAEAVEAAWGLAS